MLSAIIAINKVARRFVDPHPRAAIKRNRPVGVDVHLDRLAEIAGIRWRVGKTEKSESAIAKISRVIVIIDIVNFGVVASVSRLQSQNTSTGWYSEGSGY